MSESEYAATLLDYLCDARNYAENIGKRTLATIATVANAEELATKARINPLAPTRGL